MTVQRLDDIKLARVIESAAARGDADTISALKRLAYLEDRLVGQSRCDLDPFIERELSRVGLGALS